MKAFIKTFSAIILFCLATGTAKGQSSASYSDLSVRFLEAAYEGNYSVVADCIQKGVNINVQNWDGTTALLYATALGNKQIVKLLLEKGANVNVQPNNGLTALITASQFGYTEIAEMLLADSAKTDMADNNKATALHYSSLYNNDTIVFMLLESGANPDLTTYDKASPLTLAAINGSYESAYLLIESGANPDHKDSRGFTPLMLASQNGLFEIAKLLISNGADVNLLNYDGFSALSLAIINKHADVARLLTANGANTAESNSISLNARSLAKISGDTAIINLLKKSGAKPSFFPAFKSTGYGVEFNAGSGLLTGLFLTQYDLKFNMVYNLGFSFRPSAHKISFTIPDVGSYQFMERRYMFNFGIGKNFRFDKKNNAGIHLGGRMLYSFGKYRGTNIFINGGLTAAPQTWLYVNAEKFQIRLGYHYSHYGEKDLNSSHFTLNLIHNFSMFKNDSFNRKIKWLE